MNIKEKLADAHNNFPIIEGHPAELYADALIEIERLEKQNKEQQEIIEGHEVLHDVTHKQNEWLLAATVKKLEKEIAAIRKANTDYAMQYAHDVATIECLNSRIEYDRVSMGALADELIATEAKLEKEVKHWQEVADQCVLAQTKAEACVIYEQALKGSKRV